MASSTRRTPQFYLDSPLICYQHSIASGSLPHNADTYNKIDTGDYKNHYRKESCKTVEAAKRH